MAIVFPANRIPSPNLAASLSLDDLENWMRTLDFELFTRTQLIISDYYGIYDTESPNVYRSDMPLLVTTMPSNDVLLKVTGGTLVFKCGALAKLDTLEDISLPNTNANEVFVVYARYGLKENELGVNRFNVLVPRYYSYQDDANIVGVMTLTEYQDLTDSELDITVALAVVTVKSDCSVTPEVTSLTVDLTSTVYTWNRPWLSATDARHREEKGTGSASVPHSLSINDLLAAGNIGLLDAMNKGGFLISKARHLSKAPGKLCIEEIGNRIISVAESTVFNDPVQAQAVDAYFGISSHDETKYAGAPYMYVELGGYPLTNNYIVWADNDDDSILDIASFTYNNPGWSQIKIGGGDNNFVLPAYVPEGSNLLVLPWWAADIIANNSTNLKIAYLEAPMLCPPGGSVSTLGSSLTFRQPDTNYEAVVCDGRLLTDVGNLDIDFSTAGPVPSMYLVYAKKSASSSAAEVVRSPQTVVSPKLLSSVSGTQTSVTKPTVPAYLRVGLAFGTLGTTPSGLNVQVQITGKDADGLTLSETVSFIGSAVTPPSNEYVYYQWTGDVCSSPSNPLGLLLKYDVGTYLSNLWSYCWVRTANKYKEITGWSVPAAPIGVQPECKVVIEAILDPSDSDTVRKWCPVAEVSWNGVKVTQIRDARPVNYNTSFPSISKYGTSADMTDIKDSFYSMLLINEDFDNIRYASPLHTKVPNTNDNLGGLSPNSYPMFGNGLVYPDGTDLDNFPTPYIYEKYNSVWVSKPMLCSTDAVGPTEGATFGRQTFSILLRGGRRLNNVNLKPVGHPSSEEVLIRFLTVDTNATQSKAWTKWRAVDVYNSRNSLIAVVSASDDPAGGYYKAYAVQILVKGYNKHSGVSLWVTDTSIGLPEYSGIREAIA